VLSLRIANWDAKDSHFGWGEHIRMGLEVGLIQCVGLGWL